jgi:hypothetical protein
MAIPQGFSFALCGPETGLRIKTPISSSGRRQALSGLNLAFYAALVGKPQKQVDS